jgi:regulatory protein
LERAALHYLERYASSAENLHRVLMRRVLRSAHLHGSDLEAGQKAVDNLIHRYKCAGLLDDSAYATGRAASLHRQGKSSRWIARCLQSKGVGSQDIEAALSALAETEGQAADLRAAMNYARRRRIGPWREPSHKYSDKGRSWECEGECDEDSREAYREKDMAALARQGFGYDIARQIIEAGRPEDLTGEEDL